jgi:hypothetical protein
MDFVAAGPAGLRRDLKSGSGFVAPILLLNTAFTPKNDQSRNMEFSLVSGVPRSKIKFVYDICPTSVATVKCNMQYLDMHCYAIISHLFTTAKPLHHVYMNGIFTISCF